ncbi:hypothetical protein [Agrobacterium larrymoorei]|uniref:Uncharacterized protein n=1 Tax=Agrobacterium larrymoorei TaxID=160699 RepID=A0A4D7E3G9_9HYPH|nr:hypothetical protein [Agrobacterium larrymoorei]QCJ00707.1 hypothetical protein CFBP5473_22200 [Agrobacterium larrymoorei]QYA10708.1 hypothetical protein J5285_24450 [Agrobacterium larrymoorei]
MPKQDKSDIKLVRTWTLPATVTMGSAVRAKGVLQEIQARLPTISKKSISLEGVDLTLAMAASEKTTFNAAAAIASKVVAEAVALPVIPREIEDVLAIKTSERHRWLADGRLPSAGTRTVRLNGRARQITFHVFDPRVVEELLDTGVVEEWRVEEAEAKAEKKQQAAYQAKLTRSLKKQSAKRSKRAKDSSEDSTLKLGGWEEFDIDGLLH